MTHIVVLYQDLTVILKKCVQKRMAIFMKSQRNARKKVYGFALEKNYKIERAVRMIAKVLATGHQLMEMVIFNNFMERISERA